jgi:hypothetical protein
MRKHIEPLILALPIHVEYALGRLTIRVSPALNKLLNCQPGMMRRVTTNAQAEARGLCLHADDNVATLLVDTPPGPVQIFGEAKIATLYAIEPIAGGHKLALRAIAAGAPVVKYGVIIGLASDDIAAGAWVHTHNCRSRLDERSHILDRHTGAPTDTPYV